MGHCPLREHDIILAVIGLERGYEYGPQRGAERGWGRFARTQDGGIARYGYQYQLDIGLRLTCNGGKTGQDRHYGSQYNTLKDALFHIAPFQIAKVLKIIFPAKQGEFHTGSFELCQL